MTNAPATQITREGHTVVVHGGLTMTIDPANPNPTRYKTYGGLTGAINRRIQNAMQTSTWFASAHGEMGCDAVAIFGRNAKDVINVLVDAGYRVKVTTHRTPHGCTKIGIIGNMDWRPVRPINA
jgi:hypothetical protein